MMTQITREMKVKGKSSRTAGGPSLKNGKPYRNPQLKVEARANAFRPNKGKFRGTHVSFTKVQFHGDPKVHQDLTQ